METIAYTVSGTTTEVSLTALGIGVTATLELGTHGESKFTLPLASLPPETAVAIPFEAQCIIYTGRTGSGGSWSGGTKLFQGRRTDNSGKSSGSGVSQELIIEDAWYDLRHLTMQTTWPNVTGYSGGTYTYGTPYTWPDVILFQPSAAGQFQPNGTFAAYSPLPVNGHISTGQTIEEILAYAIYIGGANLQIGQIDPDVYVPFYPVRSMRCADALKACLRVHPDCTCEIDYTTTPPTFNIRQRSNLTGITLPYKSSSGGKTGLTSTVKPRPDLVPTRVGIYIKATTTVNSQAVIDISADIYPSGPSGLRSFDASVDMTGPKLSKTSGTITSASFDPTSLTWWAKKVPALASQPQGQIPASGTGALTQIDSTINGGGAHPKGIQVVDDTGAAINLGTYAYELISGNPAPWMTSLQVIEANVIAYFSYEKATTSATLALTDVITEHMHTTRVKLVNVATTTYNNVTTLATGETYPTGLAQAIYTSLSTLQYNFVHTIFESPYATMIKPGKNCLNLSGGLSAWSTMNAMIQSVSIEFMFSPGGTFTATKTTVNCGPVEHLEAGELVQLFNMFTNRDLGKINPNERNIGADLSGGQVTLGTDGPKENSVPVPPIMGTQNLAAPDPINTGATLQISIDATSGQIPIKQLQTSAGTLYTTGIIAPTYNGSGPPNGTNLAANAYYRKFDRYIDTVAKAEYVCTLGGTPSTSTWAEIAGGGGTGVALQQFKIVSDGGDYWICNTWDGGTQGTVNQNVIKPYKIRAGANAITSETIRGNAYAYGYTPTYISGSSGPVLYYTRNVTQGGTPIETDVVIPDALVGDIIYAAPCTTTIVGSVPVTVLTAAVNFGGSGYTAGDVGKTLTVFGGTGTSATLTIHTLSGGVITSVLISNSGQYTVAPPLTANAATGSTTGSGATFNLTMAPPLEDVNADGRAWCLQ